jgi:hypothetical protein
MKSSAAIADRIHSLEQRLENRRVRLRNDVDETKLALGTTTRRWLPVAAAAGAGLAALWLVRRSPPQPSLLQRFTAPWQQPVEPVNRRGVRWASLLGLASTAYKLGTNPHVRAFLGGLRRRRAGYPY